MNLIEKRDELTKLARELVEAAKGGDPEAAKAAEEMIAEIQELNQRIQSVKAASGLLDQIGADDEAKPRMGGVKSLGAHVVSNVADRIDGFKGVTGASLTVPEFKAATDPHVTVGTDGTFSPAMLDVDTSIVSTVPRLTVTDLFTTGTIAGQAVTYFVESGVEGAFKAVAEGGQKPQIKYNYTRKMDGLSKIAGFIKESDEILEDLEFLASEINARLLQDLDLAEEAQLLNGDGTGGSLVGVLNRSGIQTETATASADLADAIYRGVTKISTGAHLSADAVVMHPTDYESLRLAKDQNNQYYGGGYFTGAYGQLNNVVLMPPLWGLSTVVTPSIAEGTALVGAFKTAAMLYRKGGVRVDMTNSHDTDFAYNLVTVRAEKRAALAVRRPAGFVKVTVGA
ncbi:MAG: phage major capsid protein [Actinomycetaceae bacterium]|nr:phage major capsid protein [Actinomycetaceae bacterium]